MSERPFGFVRAMQFTLPWETGRDKKGNLRADGGLHYRDGGKPTKYGIWKGANPDIDVENLTVEAVMPIYKERYWDVYTKLKPVAANLESLPAALAVAVFDVGVMSGVDDAIDFLGNALQARNPVKSMNQQHLEYLEKLARQNPKKFGPNINGWRNRINDRQKYCEVLEAECQAEFGFLEKIKNPALKPVAGILSGFRAFFSKNPKA